MVIEPLQTALNSRVIIEQTKAVLGVMFAQRDAAFDRRRRAANPHLSGSPAGSTAGARGRRPADGEPEPWPSGVSAHH